MKRIARTIDIVAAHLWTFASVVLIVGVAGPAVFPSVARAQQQLVGTTTVINTASGDQVNPHVDCNLASYTNDTGGLQEIHYFDFTTNTDQTARPWA